MVWTIPRTVFTIPDVLSLAECADHIARAEQIGFEAAPVITFRGPKVDEEVRNNDRILIDDNELAALLWARLQRQVPAVLDGREAIGFNERFRYYRYRPGQKFALHRDGTFRRENGEESKLTCLLYLNDDFSGGQTAVKERVVEPRCGMALLFRHEFLHEGRPVLEGTKYLLRTDVMYDQIGRNRG